MVGCTKVGCLEYLCYDEACRENHGRLSLFWEGQKKPREFAFRPSIQGGRYEWLQKACFPDISHLSLLEHLLYVKCSFSQEFCIISYFILATTLQHQDHVWGQGSLGGCGLIWLCSWWLATLRQEPGPVWLQTACFRVTWTWTLCMSRRVKQVSARSRASSKHERETGDVRS